VSYPGLEPYLRGSAGAGASSARKPHMSYVDQLTAEKLLATRIHIGHQRRKMERGVSGYVYGIRHNIAVYDLAKTWRSMRTVFYGFAEMAQYRSSFFLLAPNPDLPLRGLIERMRREYPFRYNKFSSLYMVGYSDTKWVDGVFSNWKVTHEYARHIRDLLAERPSKMKFRRLRRYLRGVEGVDVMAKIIPDFVLVLAPDRGALHEAVNADIPLVGLVDTNTNPAPFLYPVYGNDDSVESLQFMLDLLRQGVIEGRRREHETFALTLVKKIKAQLAPSAAVGAVADIDARVGGGVFPPDYVRQYAAASGLSYEDARDVLQDEFAPPPPRAATTGGTAMSGGPGGRLHTVA
jgi:small subunit ribosomal protein S2